MSTISKEDWQRAFTAIAEDLMLFGEPAVGPSRDQESITEFLVAAAALIGIRGKDLTAASLWLVREIRRRHPGVTPIGLLHSAARPV